MLVRRINYCISLAISLKLVKPKNLDNLVMLSMPILTE
jgi:hypothetical protein